MNEQPSRQKKPRPNPFMIGGVGLLLMLGGYLGIHSATDLGLLLQSRIAFFLGLAIVLLGLVVWVREARLPDEPVQEPDEGPPEESPEETADEDGP
jgi:hypothetical protein